METILFLPVYLFQGKCGDKLDLRRYRSLLGINVPGDVVDITGRIWSVGMF